MVLRKLREDTDLSQSELANLMGYPNGKGKISEIENGKLPIREEDIRCWVQSCKKTILAFYILAADCERTDR